MTLSSPRAMPEIRVSGEAIPLTSARRLGSKQRYLLQAADLTALTASALIGALVVSLVSPTRAGDLTLRNIALSVVAMSLALHLHGLYRRPASRIRPSGWWRPAVIARALPSAVLISLATDAFILRGGRMTLTAAVAMAAPAAVLVWLCRRLLIRAADPTVARVLVVGTGPVSDRLTSRLRRCGDIQVVGHVDDGAESGGSVLGGLAELPALCSELRIDRVIVASPNASDAVIQDSLRQLESVVPISEVPRLFELHNWRSESEELEGLTLINLPTASLGLVDRSLKRFIDLTVAACALTVSAPLLALIAAAIKMDSPGPVFFRQERTGRGGQTFSIFKFRSMTADAWEKRNTVAALNRSDGPLFKMEHDPRVTRVGSLIRKTSLDEIPQLINVVRGEMSLVGPRPLPTEEASRIDGPGLARQIVKPGITGLWQVCGRSDLSYADLQHLDSVYVRSWSLMWDLRILAKTPQVVFRRSGAY
jgi:exopolysaccharide biosynthesis polyprenyl glycosylphosphotransferase